MNVQASIEQVAGILVREELRFDTHRNGQSYRLRFGQDAIFIHFSQWRQGVRICVTSPALQRIDQEEAAGAVAHARLDDLNRCQRFVKWLLDDGTLLAVHDLLGDELQRSELVNAIYAMASAVSAAAEELAGETGGLRYADMCALESDSEIEVEEE